MTVTKRILIQSENNNKKREKKGMGRGKGRQKKITYTGTVAKERERYLYDVRTAWSHQMEFESFSSFYVKKKNDALSNLGRSKRSQGEELKKSNNSF